MGLGGGGWVVHLCLGVEFLHEKFEPITLLILVGIPSLEKVILA